MSKQIEVIKKNVIVPIEIGGGYYKRVQALLVYLLSQHTMEEKIAANEQIRAKNITEEWVLHYETLLILCQEVEKNARAKGDTEMVEIDDTITPESNPQ